MSPAAPEPASDIVLQRVTNELVRAIEHPAGPQQRVAELPGEQLLAYVAEHEPARPRWIWDSTTRWYPALLSAGLRVERCLDLRLAHLILMASPFADPGLMAGPESGRWGELSPASAAAIGDDGLFVLHEHSGFLGAADEFSRQEATLAGSPQRAQLRLLLAAESSGALAAAEMTHAGLPWNTAIHERLLTELLGPRPAAGHRPVVLERLLPQIRDAFESPSLNPDSPGELLSSLRAAGLPVTDTRSWTLERIDHPGIPPLLEYRKLSRLQQANGWRWIDTWVRDGRFRPDYLPGGVVTGRWAAHGGGALSLPSQLKPAVVADPGWTFVVADVAQLEPRILAAMSGDAAMASAAQASDLYAAMVADGTVATRDQAKLGILGAMYGGTRGESGRMVKRLRTRYPRAIEFVEQAARAGERGEVVHTLLGRGSPPSSASWANGPADLTDPDGGLDPASVAESRAWGRFTRNFVVQGTGAEWALSWMALLRNSLRRLTPAGELATGPHLCFFLHDEVVVHTPAELAEEVTGVVRQAAADAGRILFGSFPVDFPLSVTVASCYADAD